MSSLVDINMRVFSSGNNDKMEFAPIPTFIYESFLFPHLCISFSYNFLNFAYGSYIILLLSLSGRFCTINFGHFHVIFHSVVQTNMK